MINDFFNALFKLAIDMGFYMMIGLVLVGVLNVFIKKQWIAKHLGGSGIWPIIKASIMGVPLPLCSCGVVPTGLYLKDKGASDPSAISFLISTPQTGADSIIATYGLMGPLFAWYRPLAAFISGVIGGIAVKLFGRSQKNEVNSIVLENLESEPLGRRAKTSFKYAFGEFIDDIAVHFIIGLIAAALIAVVIPADFIVSIGLGSGIISMLLMIVIGAPMYICSTSSIPIAVMLIAKGLSPGAAFVFLFMGPFTNAASLILISKKFGKRTTAIYFLSAAAAALGFGFLLDYISSFVDMSFAYSAAQQSSMTSSPLQIAVASFFLVLVVYYAVKRLINLFGKIRAKKAAEDKEFATYIVEGMDCKNCASGLEAAFRGEEGVASAEIDFDNKKLTIWGQINKEEVKKMVEAHGYALT